MLFFRAIPLSVWRAACCSEFETFNVNLSVITVCLPVIFELSGPRNLLKTFGAIDRLRLWKHCLHSLSFQYIILIKIYLRAPGTLPTRDVYNIILRPLYIFTSCFDSCHTRILIHDCIVFGQLSVK